MKKLASIFILMLLLTVAVSAISTGYVSKYSPIKRSYSFMVGHAVLTGAQTVAFKTPGTCTDTDGENYQLKGIARGVMKGTANFREQADRCGSLTTFEKRLQEFVCTSNGFVEPQDVLCLDGCRDGACLSSRAVRQNVPQTQSPVTPVQRSGGTSRAVPAGPCSDPDGQNQFNRSTSKGFIRADNTAKQETDRCASDKNLLEFFCSTDGFLETQARFCPGGCRDGICLAEVPVVASPPPAGCERPCVPIDVSRDIGSTARLGIGLPVGGLQGAIVSMCNRRVLNANALSRILDDKNLCCCPTLPGQPIPTAPVAPLAAPVVCVDSDKGVKGGPALNAPVKGFASNGTARFDDSCARNAGTVANPVRGIDVSSCEGISCLWIEALCKGPASAVQVIPLSAGDTCNNGVVFDFIPATTAPLPPTVVVSAPVSTTPPPAAPSLAPNCQPCTVDSNCQSNICYFRQCVEKLPLPTAPTIIARSGPNTVTSTGQLNSMTFSKAVRLVKVPISCVRITAGSPFLNGFLGSTLVFRFGMNCFGSTTVTPVGSLGIIPLINPTSSIDKKPLVNRLEWKDFAINPTATFPLLVETPPC